MLVRVWVPLTLVLLRVAGSTGCTPASPGADDAGPDGGDAGTASVGPEASTGGKDATADTSAPDAQAASEDDAAPASDAAAADEGNAPADSAPADDASAPEDAASLDDGGGVADAGTLDAADASDVPVPAGPHWANWPMPNPASAGLPNPSSYDTSTPGIVRDLVTGLSWQQADTAFDGGTMQSAAAYCAALRAGGFSDWRLPSRIEIWSIQDYMSGSPAIDPVFSTIGAMGQPNVTGAAWTSTPGNGNYTYMGVEFGEGTPQTMDTMNGQAFDGANAIRCVRGDTSQPSPHYVVQNGTVFDNGTKLTWQQGYDPIPSLPNGVASYCATLLLDGGGWRAPSVKELETLVDDTAEAPALDPVFQVPSGSVGDLVFWSGSPWTVSPQSGESVYVDFQDGSTGTGDNTLQTPPFSQWENNNLYQVRCVR